MAHLSYNEFKDKFGDLGITEWVKYNWIGWSEEKTALYLRKHLTEIAEIDFEDTASVDLGTLEWTYDSGYTQHKRWYVYEGTTMKLPSSNDDKANILSDNYITRSITEMHSDGKLGIGLDYTNGNLYVYNDSDTIQPSGILAYEKA